MSDSTSADLDENLVVSSFLKKPSWIIRSISFCQRQSAILASTSRESRNFVEWIELVLVRRSLFSFHLHEIKFRTIFTRIMLKKQDERRRIKRLKLELFRVFSMAHLM